jgi:hypothetical protein
MGEGLEEGGVSRSTGKEFIEEIITKTEQKMISAVLKAAECWTSS